MTTCFYALLVNPSKRSTHLQVLVSPVQKHMEKNWKGAGTMGNNPKRTPENRTDHDRMVKIVAEYMLKKNYTVWADHINWPNGVPPKVRGHRPDVAAGAGLSRFYFEVEDCLTYWDDHTRSQLTSFSGADTATTRGTCYVVVPDACPGRGNPAEEMQELLRQWGLNEVKIGVCNPRTGVVDLR